jgi:2-oxoglutarate ferredoxin oxidoreductase subunit alpha
MSDRVNDFSIKIANVNGTGSASANGLILKAIFRMGIPVVGKNFFPSNIQGLPTWYEIRVSGEGFTCRGQQIDLMVAMNAESYDDDLREVASGGYLLYDSTWPRKRQLQRDDVTVLGVPLARMCNEKFDNARARILMKNVAYVGAVAALIGIDLEVIRQLLTETFSKKPALIQGNLDVIEMGYDYAREHFECPLGLRLEPMDATRGHILIDGNSAAALGCVYAGATVGAWYPITPSTSMMDAFKGFCEKYRRDPDTGEANYIIIQAEDELAAIGMVVGANWNGARCFTPTSGPGISLMTEILGFAYFTEIPAVVFDVQRAGPSTGLPTRTQQSDILSCVFASHGDTRHIALFPADPKECFEHAVAAFDLAERVQTPVIVLSDLDIGMNDWMVPDFEWDDDFQHDRGKVYHAEELAEMAEFHRYADVDGDGIPYRTFPGEHPKGSYFTRGSGHTAKATYTEDPDEYVELMERLSRKFQTATKLLPKPVIRQELGVKRAIITIGGCAGAVEEAHKLLANQGVEVNYMRVCAFPFAPEVERFMEEHEQIFVVEQNRDGQLRQLLVLETNVEKKKLQSILHYSGAPMAAAAVVDGIIESLQKEAAA